MGTLRVVIYGKNRKISEPIFFELFQYRYLQAGFIFQPVSPEIAPTRLAADDEWRQDSAIRPHVLNALLRFLARCQKPRKCAVWYSAVPQMCRMWIVIDMLTI